MFESTAVLIANSGPQLITNPLTLTVSYNSNSTNPHTKSRLLLEPCSSESNPTVKNHLNINLILISQRKHWLSTAPLLDPFSICKTDKPASTQLTFFWIHNPTLHQRLLDKIKRILLESGVTAVLKPFFKLSVFSLPWKIKWNMMNSSA